MGPDKNKYDKYENYKSSWIKIDNGDLELIEPISVKRFVFPNDNGFYIEILLNNKIVGSFHCYYDEDEGQMNDIEILPEYRNIGLGKILLLKAIELSNDIFGGFSSDVRGLTKEQEQVYRSLNKDGALVNWSEINYKRAQEVIDLISEKLNNNMNLQESIKKILREEIDQRVINIMVKSVLDGTVQISKLDDYGLTGDEIREVRSQTRVEIINSILKIIKSNSIEKPYIENIKKIIRDLKTYTLLRTEDFNLILDNFFGENRVEKTSSGYDVYDNNGYKIYHESWSYWETYINNENGKRIYQINSSGNWKKWEYDKYGTVIYYETSDGKLLDKRPKKYY